jgi:PAS domain S-box-containing protein
MAQYARSLIEASLDPLVTISPDGKITDVNEATIKVTGVLREELVGTDFSNYFTEPDKAREGYRQVFAKGSVTDYPPTIRHVDGRLTSGFWVAGGPRHPFLTNRVARSTLLAGQTAFATISRCFQYVPQGTTLLE